MPSRKYVYKYTYTSLGDMPPVGRSLRISRESPIRHRSKNRVSRRALQSTAAAAADLVAEGRASGREGGRKEKSREYDEILEGDDTPRAQAE